MAEAIYGMGVIVGPTLGLGRLYRRSFFMALYLLHQHSLGIIATLLTFVKSQNMAEN
jgi:hypothetical protein